MFVTGCMWKTTVIIVVNYCVCMILMRNAWKKQKIRFEIKSVNLKLILYNVKNGISLTLGNLSSIFLTGIGTLLSAICWYFMSVYDFKYIKYNIKELSYPFVQVCIYLICGLCFKAILGFAIYIFMTLMITYFLLPDTINKALNFICVKIKK